MLGVSFLYPLFLIGAAAIAVPIVLHLLRRRTETVVDFPAVRLLDKTPVERQRRRRLRELILLALRVTALLLLAIAFARPYLDRSGGVVPAATTVIALDTSMSLSAPGQFDKAREAARRAVEQAPALQSVALVTFADAATLVVPATSDRGAVVAAIDRTSPTAGGTRFRSALARASEAITGGQGRIVVVSDLQQAGWEAADEGAVPDNIAIEIQEVPPPPGNLAVTAARRDRQGIVAAVHNFGTRPARAAVSLIVEGKKLATETIELAAQAAGDVRLQAALPASGGAEIRVDDAAGYQADNARYLVLDPPGAVPVTVITAEPPASSNAGLYVERALSVADDGRAFAVTVLDGPSWTRTGAGQAAPGAIVVLGTSTLDRGGRERIAAYLRDGGRVLVALGPDVDLATLADTVGTDVVVDPAVAETGERSVTLVATDGRHPIFRPFLSPTGALGDVTVERYRQLRAQSGRTVLARFSGAGDAMTEQAVGRGRLLLFASDLDNRWNRFPLNPAFVPWAIETARYLSLGRQQPSGFTLPDVPAAIQPVPGVQTVPGAGAGQQRRVSVNVDIRESNPARTSADEFAAAVTRQNEMTAGRAQVVAREQEERQRLWQLGLVVMFVALAAEGFIGRRAI